MKFLENFKVSKDKTKNILKKENMIVIILIGVLLLVIAIPVNPKKPKTEDVKQQPEDINQSFTDNSVEDNTDQTYVENLESRVEDILSSMEGVGNVKVMITLQSSQETIVEKDMPTSRSNISETDGSGGNRNTNEMDSQETTVYTTNQNGDKIPYVIKTKEPEIEGVTVVAQGGDNAVVQKNISEVIQALFHIELHKIKVVKMR